MPDCEVRVIGGLHPFVADSAPLVIIVSQVAALPAAAGVPER